MKFEILAPIALAAFLLSACDFNTPKDYNPKEDFQNFLKKQEEAKAAGAGAASAVAEVPGKQTFETYCAACHGIDGLANGAGAAALNPKPRNFTDKAWQAKVDDQHIYKVIKEGGASVGLSGSMAAWGAVIPDAEISNVVKYVRHFGQ